MSRPTMNEYQYQGILCGYAAATGRGLAPSAPPPDDEAMTFFNRGYDQGFHYARNNGPCGLLESVIAYKIHLYCPSYASRHYDISGGRTPLSLKDVASICSPN